MARAPRDNYRGIVVILALVACGVLNAVHRANVGKHGHDPVTGIVRDAALVPAQTATVRIGRWFKTNVYSLFEGPRLARQNRELQARVLALSVENKQLADAQAENDRLRALLDFQQKSPKPLLAAEVTALKPSPQSDTVELNRGIADGVHLHSIVVASNGAYVGQVIDVSSRSATALMLTDNDSSVGAQIIPPAQPTRPAGAATSNGNVSQGGKPGASTGGSVSSSSAKPVSTQNPAPDTPASTTDPEKPVGICRGHGGWANLIYLRSDAEVKPGEQVTTSGLGKDIPAGIPIGTVLAVNTDTTLSMKTATIRPAADLDHLDEAFILR